MNKKIEVPANSTLVRSNVGNSRPVPTIANGSAFIQTPTHLLEVTEFDPEKPYEFGTYGFFIKALTDEKRQVTEGFIQPHTAYEALIAFGMTNKLAEYFVSVLETNGLDFGNMLYEAEPFKVDVSDTEKAKILAISMKAKGFSESDISKALAVGKGITQAKWQTTYIKELSKTEEIAVNFVFASKEHKEAFETEWKGLKRISEVAKEKALRLSEFVKELGGTLEIREKKAKEETFKISKDEI